MDVYRLMFSDPRTPILPKVLLGPAIGYLALLFIPDFLPLIGHLDDLIIVPGFVWLALKYIPAWVVKECQRKVKKERREP